jgi:hypothetical protein
MKRLALTLLVGTFGASLAAAPALAKGPTTATIDGPGLLEPVSLSGSEGSGPLGEVAMSSGFYPQVFRQEPDPVLRSRPKGDLGPRYVVLYAVPGPDNGANLIRQDLYPYATPSPVSFMEPGQSIFGIEKTYGGWYVSGGQLKEILVAAGLPRTRPTGSDSPSVPWTLVGALVGTGALLAGSAVAVVVVRRRPHPAL